MRKGIDRAAGLLALSGQFVSPLSLFANAVTPDGDKAICPARSAAGFDRSVPAPGA